MDNTFKLANDNVYIVAESPGGMLNSLQFEALAALSKEHNFVTKITESHQVGIMLKEGQLDGVAKALNEAGLLARNYQQGLRQPISCIGGACPQASLDALAHATALGERLQNMGTQCSLSIGLNGCPRNCVPVHLLDIAVSGTDSGYDLYLGGSSSEQARLARLVARGIPEVELAELVESAISFYEKNADGSERLWELIARLGVAKFVELFGQYGVASQDEPPSRSAISEIESLDITADLEVKGDWPPDDGAVKESSKAATPAVGDPSLPASDSESPSYDLSGFDFDAKRQTLSVSFRNGLKVQLNTEVFKGERRELFFGPLAFAVGQSDEQFFFEDETIQISVPKKEITPVT